MCEKSDSESRNLDTPRKTCPGHVFGHVWAIQLPTHGMTFPKTNKKKKTLCFEEDRGANHADFP